MAFKRLPPLGVEAALLLPVSHGVTRLARAQAASLGRGAFWHGAQASGGGLEKIPGPC